MTGLDFKAEMKLQMTTNSVSDHIKKNYRPDIDGLRAFAVLSVVLYHAFPKAIHGGFIGVDIFFVISGFLISSILLKEITEGTFSLAAFYGRRIRRLFPALAVCLATVLAYGFVVLLPSELTQLGKHVFFGAAFLSNIAIWSETGYFGIAATLKPLLHLWSLGIEEQFYILWPTLLWMAFRLKTATARLVVVLFLASFSINVFLSTANILADFFLPISRFWEFLAGAALALPRQPTLTSYVRSWISSIGFAALLISAELFNPELRFPGWWALLPVSGAMALIAAGPNALVNRTILSHRAAVFVGLISYPFYLWHWPLISYAYIIRLGKIPTPLMAAGLVIVSFLLAWATYYFIECPVRFGTHRHRRTQITAACMAALGGFGLAVWTENGFPGRFPSLPGLDMRKISEAARDPVFQATKGMDVSNYDGTWVAHLGRGERKVALSGDSLLFQYGPRVQQLADEGQLAANTFFVTGGSCAPLPGMIQQDDFAHCTNMPGILLDLVQREKIQTVVLGASWGGYGGAGMKIERDGKRFSFDDVSGGKDVFYANLEDYVRLLQDHGAKVFLVRGVPVHQMRFDPAKMVERGPTGFRIAPDVDKDVPTAELRNAYTVIDDRLREISIRTGAALLDAFPDICENSDHCSPFFATAEPKYSDGVHLRPSFVRAHIRFLDFLLK
jgi:peptidoglycan/LPS O-acetylase OafA/YrhL